MKTHFFSWLQRQVSFCTNVLASNDGNYKGTNTNSYENGLKTIKWTQDIIFNKNNPIFITFFSCFFFLSLLLLFKCEKCSRKHTFSSQFSKLHPAFILQLRRCYCIDIFQMIFTTKMFGLYISWYLEISWQR